MTTSVKAKFRPSRVNGKPGAIYFQVIHGRVARQISTGYKLFPGEWKQGEVALPEHNPERSRHLEAMVLSLQTMKKRVEAVIRRLDESGKPYTADEVVAAYQLPNDDEHSLRVFSHKLAEHLKRTGKHRLAETYTSSVNSFLRFRGEQGDIRLDEIDEDLVKEYEHYLLEECGLCRNTSSFYNRNLRAIYNRAVKKKLTIDRHPFAEVYTGVDKTTKRAIPIQTMKEIKDLDLSKDADMAFARDLYLMSFDLRGISFVDLALLETGQLKNGYLTYSRQKTRQKLEIKWEKQMQEIVDRHHVQGTASKAYAQRGVKSVVIAYSNRPRIEMAVTQAYVELIAARAYTQKQTGVVSHAFPVGLAQTRCRRAAHVQGHAVATAKCVAQSAAQQRSPGISPRSAGLFAKPEHSTCMCKNVHARYEPVAGVDEEFHRAHVVVRRTSTHT